VRLAMAFETHPLFASSVWAVMCKGTASHRGVPS
jgi:hypothetical protein